jgi:antitoxin PrlF
MKTATATVSSKGQITIPAEVRRHLGISRSDKIGFIMEDDGTVRLCPERYSSIASLAGAAGSLDHPLSWEEVQAIAREDHLLTKHDPR